MIHHQASGVSSFEVFSSNVGQWRDTGVTCPDVSMEDFLIGQNCVVQNGIFHSVVDAARNNPCVIAYDSEKNQYRFIGLNVPRTVPAGVIGTSCGRLCYLTAGITSFKNPVVSVWFLDNDTEEWHPKWVTRTSSVLELHEIPETVYSLEALTIHPFDMDRVYLKTWPRYGRISKFLSFNQRTQKLVTFTREVEIPRCRTVLGTFSPFVLPPWPTLIPPPIWETN